jgi:hypothetical protein
VHVLLYCTFVPVSGVAFLLVLFLWPLGLDTRNGCNSTKTYVRDSCSSATTAVACSQAGRVRLLHRVQLGLPHGQWLSIRVLASLEALAVSLGARYLQRRHTVYEGGFRVSPQYVHPYLVTACSHSGAAVLMCQLFAPTQLKVTFELDGKGRFTEEEVNKVIERDANGDFVSLNLPDKFVLIANHQVSRAHSGYISRRSVSPLSKGLCRLVLCLVSTLFHWQEGDKHPSACVHHVKEESTLGADHWLGMLNLGTNMTGTHRSHRACNSSTSYSWLDPGHLIGCNFLSPCRR